MSGPFRESGRTPDAAAPTLAREPLALSERARALWLARNAHHLTLERLSVATARVVALSPRFSAVYTLRIDEPEAGACERLFETNNFRGLNTLKIRGQDSREPFHDAAGVARAVGGCALDMLTDLDISACAIGVTGLHALAHSRSMPRLWTLRSSYGHLAGGLTEFRNSALAESLSSLSLLDDRLTPEDCAALGALPRLEHLSLHRCQLDDACAETLAMTEMPALKRLWLMENQIGNAGALAFLTAEPRFPKLESLTFSRCPIDAAVDRQLEGCSWLEPPGHGGGLTYDRRKARRATADELMALAQSALGSGRAPSEGR